jgi:hypothetical protein
LYNEALLASKLSQVITSLRALICVYVNHILFVVQVKGDNYKASFHETGNIESSVWSCGPVMGLIDDVPTCEALITSMVEEAEQIIRGRLAGMVK